MGAVLQPRRPRMTSTPSMSGSPRSRIDQVGWVRGGGRERVRPGGGGDDLVVAGAQVDGERPQDLWFVVDDQHPGHGASDGRVRGDARAFAFAAARLRRSRCGWWSGGGAAGSDSTMVSPPPGVSSGVSVPPIASVSPRDRASPRPTPVVLSVSPRRWNGAKTRSSSAGGMPGPRSMTRSSTRSPRLLPATPGRRRRRAVAHGVADEVGDHPLEQPGVGEHQRQVVGHVDHHASAVRRRGRPAPAAPPRRARPDG